MKEINLDFTFSIALVTKGLALLLESLPINPYPYSSYPSNIYKRLFLASRYAAGPGRIAKQCNFYRLHVSINTNQCYTTAAII